MAAPVETLQARRYPNEELVRMRSELPTVNFAIPKLNKHPDIAGIVRIPDEAINNPDRFSCKTQTLTESARLLKMNQTGPKRAGRGSSVESELPVAVSDQFIRDRQNTQWYLRQRNNSDRSSQPHSAPSGIVAQQSENFQRFYRAVVSPTHVRVTAGGKIVPNTRAVGPPPLEWNGDKFAFEPRTTLPESESGNPAIHWPPAPLLPLGFPQLPPGGFLQSPSFLPPALPAPFGPMVHSQHLGPFAGHDQSTTDHGAADNHTQNGAPTKRSIPVPQPIKISPPNQFDQSKPFMYNGQVVYPVLPGTPLTSLPVPISILGNPNFAQPSPTSGSFIPPHLSMPFLGFPQPLMPSQNGQPMPVILPPQIIGADNSIYAPPFAQLSNSHNTMAQIQGLRDQLMHVDNQAANSKHQVDVPHLELHRNALMAYIEKMQEMHKAQLAHEQNANIAFNRSEKPIPTETSKDDQENGRSSTVSASTSIPELSVIPNPTETSTDVAGDDTQKKVLRPEPAFKSRLSAAAAMAPPFQPRAHTFPQPPQTSVSSSSSTVESQSQIEYRLLSRSTSDWGQGSSQTAAVGLGYISMPRAHTMHERSTRSHSQKQPPSTVRSSTFNGSSSILSSSPVSTTQVVPYLVGSAPQGMSASNVDSKELVYSRPLTTEELRARHLYWGNAPRSVQKGLPKFDGKDFYPPSPMKENAPVVGATLDTTPTRKRYSSPDDFGNLFTEPGVPGYKTPSPNHHNGDIQGTGPMLQTDTYDYMSPSTHAFQGEAEAFSASNHVSSGHGPSTPGAERQTDFSDLFMERGVPGYRSPTPPPRETSTPHANHNAEDQYIVTPENKTVAGNSDGGDDEIKTEGSWGPVSTAQGVMEDSANDTTSSESGSTPSTVEINLTSKIQLTSPARGLGDTFAERVANLASQEQKNMFLQNMLRNTAPMAATALSGEVSSATAQGYLPQYRGTAAASLAPAMISNAEHDLHRVAADQGKGFSDNLASLGLAKVLSENHPLGQKALTPRHFSPETMGAEAYMRFLALKTEDGKSDQLERELSRALMLPAGRFYVADSFRIIILVPIGERRYDRQIPRFLPALRRPPPPRTSTSRWHTSHTTHVQPRILTSFSALLRLHQRRDSVASNPNFSRVFTIPPLVTSSLSNMPSRLDTPVLTVDVGLIHKVDTRNVENLFSMWSVFSRCAGSLEEGRRLENLSWRLWNRETFCCSPNSEANATTPAISIASRSSEGRYSADVPDLSGSLDSLPDDDVLEFDHGSSSSISAPLDISRPQIQRQDSMNSRSRGRERHITPDDLEKMVITIKEKKNLEPLNISIHAYMAPPMKTTTEIATTPADSRSPESTTRDATPALATLEKTPTSVVRGFSPSHARAAAAAAVAAAAYRSVPLLNAPSSIPTADIVAATSKTTTTTTTTTTTSKKHQMFALGGSSGDDSLSEQPNSIESLQPQQAKKKNAMFTFGGSSNEEENSLPPRLQPPSALAASIQKPMSAKKQTSFLEEVATRTIHEEQPFDDDVFESDEDDVDESAIDDDDDSSEWEDSNEDSGNPSIDEKTFFQRVDSRPNLTSRRSLITTMLHQSDRASALATAASRSTPAIHRSRATSPNGPSVAASLDSDDDASSPLMMKGLNAIAEIPRSSAQPIIMTTTNTTPHQLALSPRTTRRNMLATELTVSLRQHLLWERQQKSQTANAVLKRRHTAHDVANLQQYPERVHMDKEDKDGLNASWNQYFSQGLGEYHSKGW
ncbi:hypothetical protein B7494_g3068 [Chlorociboria aeruginascens]|nr:hypothetical protein B7494_g3068 [Chlorociboria aeruginascens]